MRPRDIFGPCSFSRYVLLVAILALDIFGRLGNRWTCVGARARPGDCSDLEGLIQNCAAGQAQHGCSTKTHSHRYTQPQSHTVTHTLSNIQCMYHIEEDWPPQCCIAYIASSLQSADWQSAENLELPEASTPCRASCPYTHLIHT